MSGVPLLRSTIQQKVAASSDDGHQDSAGTVNITGALHVIDNSVTADHANWYACRFQSVQIPRNAKIVSCDLQDFCNSLKFPNMDSNVFAEAVDSSSALTTTASSISTKPRTTATAVWTGTAGATGYANSGNIFSAILQEIVNRAGWAPGNNITFIFQARSASVWAGDDWDTAGNASGTILDVVFDYRLPPRVAGPQAVQRAGNW